MKKIVRKMEKEIVQVETSASAMAKAWWIGGEAEGVRVRLVPRLGLPASGGGVEDNRGCSRRI